MPIYTIDNEILINDGKIAMHEDCCCGGGCEDYTGLITITGITSTNRDGTDTGGDYYNFYGKKFYNNDSYPFCSTSTMRHDQYAFSVSPCPSVLGGSPPPQVTRFYTDYDYASYEVARFPMMNIKAGTGGRNSIGQHCMWSYGSLTNSTIIYNATWDQQTTRVRFFTSLSIGYARLTSRRVRGLGAPFHGVTSYGYTIPTFGLASTSINKHNLSLISGELWQKSITVDGIYGKVELNTGIQIAWDIT